MTLATRPGPPPAAGTPRRPAPPARRGRLLPPVAHDLAGAIVPAGRAFARDAGRTAPGFTTGHFRPHPHSARVPVPAAPGVTEDHQ
ncbi:hypothetical protein C3489_15490 [Streptomyces sp. Ru71]|uniref:hypothetical protein n=1 Tax=Streptomyces sp. Ru71 TaxID=2080746 RepID=UPI000CDCF45A|nr:hypothetical protein [Streptomyces sp. Ru71]POX53545.1 hypothetical protein C3489_15490 [Streptomyces sp. Ru71]